MVSFVVVQLALVVRGYRADHKEFAFQMFSEASTWRADIVRVTTDGRRVPVDEGWTYRWSDLVTDRGLRYPEVEQHADGGLANQLAFLREALDWVCDNTPADHETRWLEAVVTEHHNMRAPAVVVLRSHECR